MAHYTNSGDLVDDVLFRSGEPTDGTSDFDSKTLDYVNRAYQAIWTGGAEIDDSINEVWWWLKKDPPGVLNMEPDITSLTASVTNVSTAVTMSGTPTPLVDVDVSGWFLRVTGHQDVFRVVTQAATVLTLDAIYTGATDAAAVATLFKTEFELADDFMSMIAPMRCSLSTPYTIDYVPMRALDSRWPLVNASTGQPHSFSMVDETKVRFSHYNATDGEMLRIEYDYMQLPSDLTDSSSNIPLVPRQYRRLIADVALMFLHLDKNDNRAGAISGVARRGLVAMAKENRTRMARTGRRALILPRADIVARNDQPLRTESGNIIG